MYLIHRLYTPEDITPGIPNLIDIIKIWIDENYPTYRFDVELLGDFGAIYIYPSPQLCRLNKGLRAVITEEEIVFSNRTLKASDPKFFKELRKLLEGL